jgi:GMP synthase-like glutamine amidotransferase
MKPVGIFRHSQTEGPGYFATYLDGRRLPWTVIKIDQGEPVPDGPDRYAGLVFMGGPMSVNDPLPWIPPVLDLIVKAVRADIPVLGHCLGGQLISKALGGAVCKSPVKEIGWGKVKVAGGTAASRWFGSEREFLSFHWHGETFTIPPGARCIASSEHCAHQAFALGPHLGLQCHVEMTPELIQAWCSDWEREVISLASRVASVQTPQEMQRDLHARLADLHRVADRLYERWVQGLKGGQ